MKIGILSQKLSWKWKWHTFSETHDRT